MALKLPVCRNETCPAYRSNKHVIVLQERPEDVSFGCCVCGGVQVITLNWRRAEQRHYELQNNPEYARKRKHFFLGKNASIGNR